MHAATRPPRLDPATLRGWLAQPDAPRVIDVRTPAEFDAAHIHLLEGGITAWQRQAAPVTRGPARWDIERQVRLVAGTIVFVAVMAGLLLPGLQYVAAANGAGSGNGAARAGRHSRGPDRARLRLRGTGHGRDPPRPHLPR